MGEGLDSPPSDRAAIIGRVREVTFSWRVAAALGLEWSVPEDNKLQILFCPQFAVAFQ